MLDRKTLCFKIQLHITQKLGLELENNKSGKQVSMQDKSTISYKRWAKNWTSVFSIRRDIADHFVQSNREWVLEIMEKGLVDPKRAHSAWTIQFGEAVALLGKPKAKKIGVNLYSHVIESGLYEQCSSYRLIIQNTHYKRRGPEKFVLVYGDGKPLTYRMNFPTSILHLNGLPEIET